MGDISLIFTNNNPIFSLMKKIYSLILGSLIAGGCGGTVFAETVAPDLRLLNTEKVSLSDIKKQTPVIKRRALPTPYPNQTEPIREAKGEATTYLEVGKAWTNYYGVLLYQLDFTVLGDISFDGNDVYIKNPISQFATDTYMRGTLEGDKIVCQLPQLIYQEADEEGVVYDFYVSLLNGEETALEYGSTWTYTMPESDNSVSYSLIDGKWVMDLEGYETIIGLIDDDEYWYGYGDCAVVYTEFNETPLEVPADLVTEEWAFTADGSGHNVNVGFDGDEVYIQGISSYIPDAWVKGTVDGDKIVFEGGQYMGSYSAPTGFYLAYLVGGIEFDDAGSVNYRIQPELTFAYDAEAKKMNYNYTLFVNSTTDYIRYLEMYNYPIIRLQPESFNPTPEHVTLDTFDDTYGYYGIRFNLPNVTPEGYILDTDNIYWRMFLDGDLFEFDEETYGYIDGNNTEIPYGFYSDTWEIMSSGSMTTVFLYVEGFDVLSIQVLYKDPETGRSYYSEAMNLNVITYDVTYGYVTAVEKISDANATSVEYYDLNGLRVNNPEKGIYLKRSTNSNGEVVTSKVVRR